MVKHWLQVVTLGALAASVAGCAADVDAVGQSTEALYEAPPPNFLERGNDPCESCFYLSGQGELVLYVDLDEGVVPPNSSIYPVIYSATEDMYAADEWVATELSQDEYELLHDGVFIPIPGANALPESDELRTWIGWNKLKAELPYPVYANVQ